MDSSSISSIISNSINDMFSSIFSSIDNNIYSTLDNFTFINSDILNDSFFIELFGSSGKDGILLIANALIFGFLLYYSFKLIFSYLGLTEVEKPFSFLFKLLLCSILMNFSFFICDEIIYLISILSSSIRGLGETLFNDKICFSTLILKLNSVLTSTANSSTNIFSMDGILHSIVSIGFLNLIITYGIRYMLIKIFVFLSPFCFLSLCNKNTSILFKSWFKSFLFFFLIQVFVSIILLVISSLKISANDTFSKFVLISSIFILIKANSYVKEMLGGISSDAGTSFSNLISSIKK